MLFDTTQLFSSLDLRRGGTAWHKWRGADLTHRDRTVTWTITLLAGIASLLLAVAPPVTTFLAARDRLYGALETSARLHAAQVAIIAHQTPGFWKFDGLRLSAPGSGEVTAAPERRRVFDLSGKLVVEAVPSRELAWPVLSMRAPVLDGTTRLGEAEASRSFRDGLLTACWTALASTVGAALIFSLLRIVPLRLLHQALCRASYLSAHDVLTGLPNRALFADRLNEALAYGRRTQRTPALLCLDLDHFKEVNDTLGHAAGDQLLKTLADRLSRCLREGDTLARLGGDEFAVILPDATTISDAEALAHRLLAAAARPTSLGGQEVLVGISIGIAIGHSGVDGPQLLQDADTALYQAKSNGRGQWCFFEPEMNARLLARRMLEHDLREALVKGQFFLLYQPQFDLCSRKTVGAEALLRWDRPGHGVVGPDAFIALAEESGLIRQLGAWVLHEACRTAAMWPTQVGIAVNVSPMQFKAPGFRETVIAALQPRDLAAERLELEVTEGVLLNDTDETIRLLNGLRASGIRLSLDDFGTGYSSLSYFQRFRFDKIKIDRHFVQHMTRDGQVAAIVEAVIALSRAMNVTTIAEGVETEDQAQMLRSKGCKEVQGYLYGRPMTAQAFAQLLASERCAV